MNRAIFEIMKVNQLKKNNDLGGEEIYFIKKAHYLRPIKLCDVLLKTRFSNVKGIFQLC